MNTKTKKCPLCGLAHAVKRGRNSKGKQIYFCRGCHRRFTYSTCQKILSIKHLWIEYVFGKQTVRELSERYSEDKKTIYAHLNQYQVKAKKHNPRSLHLLVDGLYFGTREDQTTWCVIVFRDHDTKENVWWTFGQSEREVLYKQGKDYLQSMGYAILSVTGDGFGGLREAFAGIPFQMCLVHMERLVIRGTTRKPKLFQGQILFALIRTIYNTDKTTFEKRLSQYIEKYRDFLNEKAISDLTGETWFVHDDLRRAVMSLKRFMPYLFTYETDRSIPPTTNSLEGHFAHLRDILNIHRGASKLFKQKIIHTILLASTIAPSEDILKEII